MIYKPFQELKLSRLGMGNMRLPTVGKESIDEAKARELIEYAYENGVNYFDTAYRYHGGESETFVGKVLSRYPRDTWNLATKFPGHMIGCRDGRLEFTGLLAGKPLSSVAGIFEEQLEKCGVEYFDFYLLHNLCETSYDFYTDEDLGVVEYLLGQKEAGRIRHLGFSAHGRPETIDSFLTWGKGCFEFAQIQLNYMDWVLQEAGKKYEVITAHGLPVMVMEPVRGGRLASLGDEADAVLKRARPQDSVVAWAFRFLQSLPGVVTVLSGMSDMEQLRENLALFSKDDPVTDREKELLDQALSPLLDLVPCTACRYCCDGCPQGLDIPKLIAMHNEIRYEVPFTLGFTLNAMGEEELPSACLSCGACTPLCPQGIDIPSVMQEFSGALAKIRAK